MIFWIDKHMFSSFKFKIQNKIKKMICLSPLTTKHISFEIRSHGGDPFVTTWHKTSEHIQS